MNNKRVSEPPIVFVAAWARLGAQMLPVRSRSHPKIIDRKIVPTRNRNAPMMGWSGKLYPLRLIWKMPNSPYHPCGNSCAQRSLLKYPDLEISTPTELLAP